jgi:hypothetical protein
MAVKLSLMTSSNFLLALAVTALTLGADPLADARNRQDRGYIRWAVTQADAAAKKNPKDAAAQYRLAVTQSIRAEVALEVHDKAVAQSAARMATTPLSVRWSSSRAWPNITASWARCAAR